MPRAVQKAIMHALLAAGLAALPDGASAAKLDELTAAERAAYLKRAKIWAPVDVARRDVRLGPQGPGAFAPGAEVTCTYEERTEKGLGHTPKFDCRLPGGDVVKVKYGAANGEVYAAVAATRLFWALGFGAEAEYPARVVCLRCPQDPWERQEPRLDRVVFDPAMIERHPFVPIAEKGKPSLWKWQELDDVDESAGGATPAERDALTLLAAFVQHGDNKEENQRLVCPAEQVGKDASGGEICGQPWLIVHDLGVTFGRGAIRHLSTVSSANFAEWSEVKVWEDPGRCEAELDARFFHKTLKDPRVSEAGRALLARQLGALSDDQIRGIFEASRIAFREWKEPGQRGRNGTPERWTAAFKDKRQQIAAARCPR